MATAEITGPDISDAPAATVLRDVEWKTYCKLRDAEANNHLRMTYLDGNLTIVSPQLAHDLDSRLLLYVVTAVARAWRVRLMAVGTTTLRREGRAELLGAGKEPDEGFYLGDDVVAVRGNRSLDLAVDPPPTLAIEVDHKADSSAALPTYARLRVPELWRLDATGRTLWFGRLVGEDYAEVARSVALSRLTPPLVLQALEARAHQPDDLDWLDWLDAWARNLPEPPPTA